MSAVNGGSTGAGKRVAVAYHYLAHYREAVFACLSRNDTRHRYEIFADRTSNLDTMLTIDPARSNSVDPAGTLNWRFIRNIWLTPSILWQTGTVKLALKNDHDVLILLGNMQFISTWLAAGLGRLRGKRILMWTHGVLREERGLRGAIRRNFYRLAHGLLLYGHRARDILISQGFDGRNLYVVYNSLDTAEQLRVLHDLKPEAVRAAKKEAGVSESKPFLISIGRMTVDKDLHLLPLALAELNALGRTVDLLFVGDGPARVEIENLAKRLGVQAQVHFTGGVYTEKALCPLIAAADICVCPGAVGLTAMHALIYGTPVITHDQPERQKPEYEAIIPGVTGAYFRRGDAQSLAAAIEAWLSSHEDRAQLADRCRQILLKNYTPEAQRRVIELAVEGVPADVVGENWTSRSVGDAVYP